MGRAASVSVQAARAGRARVAVFAFDAAESSQIRRIRSLVDCGHEVDVYAMRRRNMTADPPAWRTIHLAEVDNERLARRLLAMARALLVIAAHLGPLRRADVILARNFDLLLLAHAGRLMALRPRLPLVYECLDIHAIFTGAGRAAAAARRLERVLLARIALLVVSSPGFVRHYFAPAQGYRGPVHLLENKIWFGARRPPRQPPSRPFSQLPRRTGPATAAADRPLVLGWVGSLRCEPSFAILLGIAERLGPRVRIEMHGIVHHHAVPDFAARIARHATIAYRGPYAYPDGLAAVYGGLDLVWAQDLWQAGANSAWLLPNRIYEASYFACPSIAVAGTETARTVAERGLGFVVEEASAAALGALLERLGPCEVEARRRALLARPAAAFVSEAADVEAVIAHALAAGEGARGTAMQPA